MNTVTRPGGNPGDPQAATPYLLLRREAAERAAEEIAAWYAGGLGPDPLAA